MANDVFGGRNPKEYATTILNTAVEVITRPVDFYRKMPKSGGFADPLVFIVAMGLAAGVVQAILSIFMRMPGGIGLLAVIITPIMAGLFGFVGAAILFGIWKFMGSTQNYETAYRCAAYAAAISPITTLVHPIPYVGGLIGLFWGFYLAATASVEVHGIEPKKARTVFGALAIVFALLSIGAEYSARKTTARMSDFKAGEMTPEEAGKKMGEFMKGFKKGAGE
jgi:hypothetical protein